MKKAFTLIELLAVIIILAVIALIATPIVLNVVSDAREKAKVESANGIIDAANLYVSEAMLDETKSTAGDIYANIIDKIKGEKPDNGEVYINELNQVAVALQYGDSCYKKDYNETTPKKVEDANCSLFTPTDSSCFEYATSKVVSYDINHDVCLVVVKQAGEAMHANWSDENIESLCTGGDARGLTLDDALSVPSYLEAFTTYGAVSNVVTEDIEGARITGYTCSDTDVVIPKKIDNKTVTDIGFVSFMDKGLTSVVIPSSIKSIGRIAFSYNQLTSVNIPNSVTTIGVGAFASNQLTSVKLSSSLKTIEAGAFRDNRLTKVVIPNNVQSIEDVAFSYNQLTSVTIGNKVQKIGIQAFQSNQLTSVAIPNSVTTIGDAAFDNNQLTSVNIPNSVTTIGDSAFYNNQLTSVTIGNKVQTIGDGAFADNQLTSVTIGNKVQKIGRQAFWSNKLTNVTIPNSVTTIGDYAFADNQLTSVIIPNRVETIGKFAFADNQLTSVTIPNSVTTIGAWAFSWNDNLSTITIDKASGSIEGSPWGASNATITYLR